MIDSAKNELRKRTDSFEKHQLGEENPLKIKESEVPTQSSLGLTGINELEELIYEKKEKD